MTNEINCIHKPDHQTVSDAFLKSIKAQWSFDFLLNKISIRNFSDKTWFKIYNFLNPVWFSSKMLFEFSNLFNRRLISVVKNFLK